MTQELQSLLLFPVIGVTAAVAVTSFGRLVRVPLIVFEIVLGLIFGPAVLGWITETAFLTTLSEIGLAMLFFLAGNEIDLARLAGRPLTRSIVGWLVSIAIGVTAGFLTGNGAMAAVFIGIALTSTALGTILPVLRDAGELNTPFGISVTAVGAVGEFAPLIAISIFLSGRNFGLATLYLLGFVVIAALVVWLALRSTHPVLHRIIDVTMHTSGQFAVRLVILVLVSLVALSVVLGLDMLLGAFVAGLLFRILMQQAPPERRAVVDSKVEALGFGFLVPAFFINTGVTYDLAGLVDDVEGLVLLPVFVVLLLVARGIPSLLSAPAGSSRRDLVATGFFGATGLPIIVAVTAIGVDQGELDSGVAAALVGAGMISVLVFPLVALTLRRGSFRRSHPVSDDHPVTGTG